MDPWNTKGDHHFVTTREATHRSDETPPQYEWPVGTAGREDTTPPTAPTHRQTGCPSPQRNPAPRWAPHSRPPSSPPRTQKRGRQGTRAARPAAPTRGPTQRCPARPTTPAPHTCQFPPYSCFDTPTHRKKKSPFLDTTSPNQTDSTDDTNTICSSIDSTAPRNPCCRPFRSSFHRIYKTRHTTLTGKGLFAATGNLSSDEPHPRNARDG